MKTVIDMSKEPDPLAGNARDDWTDWRDDQGVYPTALNPPTQQEPPWWPAVENILNEYGLQAIDFVADFKAAQRKPLTDEEIENIWRRVDASDFVDCVQPFARALEAAHGIKENT